jgi:hypothetical protein
MKIWIPAGLLAACFLEKAWSFDSKATFLRPYHVTPMIGTSKRWQTPKTIRCLDATTSTTLSASVAPDLLVSGAVNWVISLASPTALVAGTILSTLPDSRRIADVESSDKTWVVLAKKSTLLLLYTAFGLQVLSLFSTVVTTSMLLGNGYTTAQRWKGGPSPLTFLLENYELEFLTIFVTFLQGIVNWIAAIAMEHIIPKKGDNVAARKMNRLVGSSLFMVIIYMLAMVNNRAAHYGNYFNMVKRLATLIFSQLSRGAFLSRLGGATFVYSLYLTVTMFLPEREDKTRRHD